MNNFYFEEIEKIQVPSHIGNAIAGVVVGGVVGGGAWIIGAVAAT